MSTSTTFRYSSDISTSIMKALKCKKPSAQVVTLKQLNTLCLSGMYIVQTKRLVKNRLDKMLGNVKSFAQQAKCLILIKKCLVIVVKVRKC